MDVLRRVISVVALPIAVATVGALACEALVPPGQFYNSSGVVQIASFGSTPTLLTTSNNGLFYVLDGTVYAMPKSGGQSQPVGVPAGVVSSMVYDGQNTLAFCAGGTIELVDTTTLTTTVTANVGCGELAINATNLVYSAAADGGMSVVNVRRDAGFDGMATQLSLPPDPAFMPTVTVGLVGEMPFYQWIEELDLVVDAGFKVIDAGRKKDGSAAVRDGGAQSCKLTKVLFADHPKALVVDASGANGSSEVVIILRGSGVANIDQVPVALPFAADADCCAFNPKVSCSAGQNSINTNALAASSDFTVAGGYLYSSGFGLIERQPIASLNVNAGSDAGLETLFNLNGAVVPYLAVDNTGVYFIMDNAIFSAPIPSSQ